MMGRQIVKVDAQRLRFEDSSFEPYQTHIPPADGVYKGILEGELINPEDLRDKFVEEKFNEASKAVLKMSKALILCFLLMNMDFKRVIDDWVWELVEDMDQWESFPYGKYTFQLLLYYMDRIDLVIDPG